MASKDRTGKEWFCPWCGAQARPHASLTRVGVVQLNCPTDECGVVSLVEALYDPADDRDSELGFERRS